MSFIQTIKTSVQNNNSHICVGLDSDYLQLPEICKKNASLTDALFQFNKEIVDATHSSAASFKSNLVFYAVYGIEGLQALKKTNEYIKKTYPAIPVIADGKRSEMNHTARLAAKEVFNEFLFDAMTVTPWFGFDTVEAYQEYENNAVFVLCHDSNPSAGDIQDVELKNGKKLYEYLTDLVVNKWNSSGNILIEAPLTYPHILKEIYDISNDRQFFLVAGLGPQGGDIQNLAIFKERKNFVINASRSIIYASTDSDFAEKAASVSQKYQADINEVLK